MPRLKGRRTTAAPASDAASAVASVEPSSTTSTSTSGRCSRRSRTTRPTVAASLYDGTTARQEGPWFITDTDAVGGGKLRRTAPYARRRRAPRVAAGCCFSEGDPPASALDRPAARRAARGRRVDRRHARLPGPRRGAPPGLRPARGRRALDPVAAQRGRAGDRAPPLDRGRSGGAVVGAR